MANDGGETGREPRVIKRYANRKLYDTRDSRYVTLQQIAEFVRSGEDVQIIDNTTKEDLTNVTLAQIVYEQEKKGDSDEARASVRSLRGMIQHGRERLMTSLREGPVGKLVTRHGDPVPGEDPPPAADPPAAQPSRKLSPKEAWDELQRMADERVKSLVSAAMGHVQQLQSEVKRLQARIEELEQRLVTLGRRAGPKKEGEADKPEDPTKPQG